MIANVYLGKRPRILLLLAPVCLLAAGCISGRTDLVDTGRIRVETRYSEKTKVSWVSVYDDDGTFVVSGRVRVRNLYAAGGHGHVDVTIADEAGETLAERAVAYTPRHIPRGHSARFTARFPEAMPDASTVQVRHHVTWRHGKKS